jgi:hypothetical protein
MAGHTLALVANFINDQAEHVGFLLAKQYANLFGFRLF